MDAKTEARLAALQRRQRGCVTTAQLLELELSRSAAARLLSRRYRPLHRGVHVGLHVSVDRRVRQAAAVLAVAGALRGGTVGLAGADAAVAFGFPLPAGWVPRPTDPVHLVTARRHTTAVPGVRLERRTPCPRLLLVDDVPTSDEAAVLADLVRRLPPPSADRFADDVLRRRPELWTDLCDEAVAVEGRPGAGRLRGLVHRLAEPTHAESERRAVAALGRAGFAGLGRTQVAIRDEAGLVCVADWASERYRVALEVNGYAWHSTRDRFERDHRVRQRLLAAGWVLVEVTAWQVWHEPAAVAAALEAAIQRQRGGAAAA